MAEPIQKSNIEEIVDKAISHHGVSDDALIPILLEINHALRYIPLESLTFLTRKMNRPEEEMWVREGRLFSLASFYHMLSLKPRGRHIVLFCESAPCHISGGRQLFQALQDELTLRPGETSSDGKWSLVTTSCLGLCGVGPVIVIDEDLFGCVTPEQLPEILARYE